MIIVDTDVLIEIFDRKSERRLQALKLLEQSGEDIAITSLSLHEILYGHFKRKKNIKEVEEMHIIDFTKEDAKVSAKLQNQAERKGKALPTIDAMIAAIVLNRNAKLFTYNTKHFKTIQNLTLYG